MRKQWVKAICGSNWWKLSVKTLYKWKQSVGHLPHKVATSAPACGPTFQTGSWVKHTHIPLLCPVSLLIHVRFGFYSVVSKHPIWLLWELWVYIREGSPWKAISESYPLVQAVKATSESNVCQQPVKALSESYPWKQSVQAMCESTQWKLCVKTNSKSNLWKQLSRRTYESNLLKQHIREYHTARKQFEHSNTKILAPTPTELGPVSFNIDSLFHEESVIPKAVLASYNSREESSTLVKSFLWKLSVKAICESFRWKCFISESNQYVTYISIVNNKVTLVGITVIFFTREYGSAL